jgi:hypothetical protein
MGNQESKVLKKLRAIKNRLSRKKSVNSLIKQKRKRIVGIAFAVVALVLVSGSVSGFMVAQVMSASQAGTTVANVGTLRTSGVAVFTDNSFATELTSLNWGTMDPGSQKTLTVYIRNEGNSPITLTQMTSNWSPSTVSSYLSLSWSYSGQKVNAGAYVQVSLTLTVSSNVAKINSFSFDLTIIGTE